MSHTRGLHHHSIRWLALLALLLATLAPGVSHALRHARGEVMPWSQLCSATGSKRIVLGDESPFAPAHAYEHCAACALHHHAPAPPVAAPVPLRTDLAFAAPSASFRAAHPALLWRAAQARAPPPLIA